MDLRQKAPFFINYTSGYLDTVSGTSPLSLPKAKANGLKSVTLYGATSQASTPTPSDPVDIVCNNGAVKWDSVNQTVYADGTVETINVHGKNLFDVNTMLVENKAIRAGLVSADNPLGSEIGNDSWNCTDYISVLPNTTYAYTIPRSTYAAAAGLVFYSDKSVDGAISGIPQTSSLTGTFTTPPNCRYMRFSWVRSARNDVQLEQGNTATDYVPYYEGGTATAEMLLKVGDYQDAQSVIDGQITRNVGIKFFDGTETWYSLNSRNDLFMFYPDDAYKPSAPMSLICTHLAGSSQSTAQQSQNTIRLTYAVDSDYGVFCAGVNNITSISDFKTWLATQYAVGTPVIVVYPLATPTTESVAGQTLQTQAGTNTLTITQAALNGLTLSATYKRGK